MAIRRNKVEDAKKIEERSHRAGMRGATDPKALKQKPQKVQNPDKLGNKGSGVFKNPARPGSGPGEFNASRFGITADG